MQRPGCPQAGPTTPQARLPHGRGQVRAEKSRLALGGPVGFDAMTADRALPGPGTAVPGPEDAASGGRFPAFGRADYMLARRLQKRTPLRLEAGRQCPAGKRPPKGVKLKHLCA